MFFDKQEENSKKYYGKMLTAIGSLSKLFSENDSPYFAPRIAENLFCKSFGAENLARSDVSYDAFKDGLGIGIKTFLYKNGASYEKVAEFNSALDLFSTLGPEEKVRKIAELRNERILTTQRIYGAHNSIYHCIVRAPGKIIACESPMDLVDINHLSVISANSKVITFEDGINQYKFNISKSVLIKKFSNSSPLFEIDINIIDDPFSVLESLLEEGGQEIIFAPVRGEEHIYLPLYSYDKGEKHVFEQSGLNQWHAKGRPRDLGEVYVPIPSALREKAPGFFPPRDTHFNLTLPNGEIMVAKVCQDNSKALMSNPNNRLGEWLLREILNLAPGELLTYEKLEEIGLDSVVIYKTSDNNYEIDFAKVGSYEDYMKGEHFDEDEV